MSKPRLKRLSISFETWRPNVISWAYVMLIKSKLVTRVRLSVEKTVEMISMWLRAGPSHSAILHGDRLMIRMEIVSSFARSVYSSIHDDYVTPSI